jgi:heme exporter protein C
MVGAGLLGLVYLAAMAVPAVRRALPFRWEHPLGAYGLLLLISGNYLGLFYAPGELFMGDVGRILHVHVPAAWVAMLSFLLAGLFGFVSLWTSRRSWDSAMEAASEVGVMEATLLCILGSIWGRATWGVWWTWDPRLTTTAVMLISFVGVLLLRAVVTDPDRRASWSGAASVLATVNVPITYMSVKWAGLHQAPSESMNDSAIDDSLRWVMYYNTWAFLFLMVWFMAVRWRIAELRAEAEVPDALPEIGA